MTMKPTADDLQALSDVLNMDIDYDEFEFSEELNNTEELVFEDSPSSSTVKKVRPVEEDSRDYTLISEPHWLINTEDIKKALENLNNVIIKSGEVVNKCVSLVRSSNKILMSFNSNEIIGSIEIPLLNTENLIPEDSRYVLEHYQLSTAVKNSASKLILKDNPESKTLVCEIMGAEIQLENYIGINESNYSGISNIDFNSLKKTEIEYGSFVTLLKNVNASDKLSMRPDDRKVRIQGKEGFSNFALVIVNYKNVNIDDLSFRLLDVQFLLKVLGNTINEVSLYQDENKNYLKTDSYTIGFPKVNTDDLKYVKRITNDLKITSEFSMTSIQFFKKLNTIRQFTGNSVSTHLYTQGGILFVHSKTANQRDVKFPVAENLDTSISIDSRLPIMTLLNTYRLFKDYETLKVSVTNNQRFIFEVEDFKLIFGNLT